MDAPTNRELYRIARDEILAGNSKISLEAIDREGTDVNAIVNAIAAACDEVVGHNIRICAGNFLDSARGTILTKYVFDKYGLVRKDASCALGTAVFTTVTNAPSNFTIPTGVKLSTADGKQFITIASATFSAGTTGPVSVAVRSILAGLDQQASIGTITSIVDVIAGAPDNLAVTNSVATSGASDEEDDDDLRSRARDFFTSVRGGTVSAIRTKALAYPGVKRATVLEVLDAYGRPAKASQLVIADTFTDGLVDKTSGAYQTQSQVLADAVFASLSDTRSCGIHVDVFVAQAIMLSVTLALSFDATSDVEQTALRARAAIVIYINGLAPGKPFVPYEAVDVLRKVPGLIVFGTEILSPVGNVIAATRQKLCTSMSMVRATSAQADRALQGNANSDAVVAP